MNTLVIYDSEFGNTARVAHAIAETLASAGTVRVEDVGQGADIDVSAFDFLVIGGPTQAHGMSPRLRAWIDSTSRDALSGLNVAVFDTRLRWPVILAGSAARSAAKQLQHTGAHLVAPPESFFVSSKEGPLEVGELEHAASWAAALAAQHETLAVVAGHAGQPLPEVSDPGSS